MLLRRPTAILLIALALAACSKPAATPTAEAPAAMPTGPVAAVPPPAGKAWADIAAATPEGGTRIGNPDAPIKFVEYASLTCPHCRDFTADAAGPMTEKYIANGKVSWEYRPFLLNSLDTVAFLLARCRGPEPFFKLMEQAYADQESWVGKYMKMTPEQQAQLQTLPPQQMLVQMAAMSGLDGFFRARGLPAAQANACLADTAAAETLAQNTSNATDTGGVNSTPTFFINGKLWTAPKLAALWPQLDPVLAQMTR